jgi:hypothetical protein
LIFALNFTCSSHVTHIALLPASIVRKTARLPKLAVVFFPMPICIGRMAPKREMSEPLRADRITRTED